ncbi:MAG TPA: YidC/Oxa1 family insertase periplasmic-domain containing protein, partial [Candidatus Synoicihabitans sp.]|nr:YidC/Oxa1 family insertase periplasmic-domain containing protein [Candidatus Synoicihabitans sp.]
MDKKNTIIGLLLLGAAFASQYFWQRAQPSQPPPAPVVGEPTAAAPAGDGATPASPSSGAAVEGRPVAPAPSAEFAALATQNRDATLTSIGNDFIEVRFTDYGGAVAEVAFKHYAAEYDATEPYVFNVARVDPILAITNVPGLGAETRYALVSSSATEVVYRATLEGRLEVTRRYRIEGSGSTTGDPYVIRHETSWRNLGASAAPPAIAGLSLGTASLVGINDIGQYLNVAQYDGDDAIYADRGELEGGGFLSWIGMKDGAPKSVVSKDGTVVWAAVKNQFFASLYTADEPGIGTTTRRVELPPFPGSSRPNVGLTGVARYPVPQLEGNGAATLAGNLYVGPKEYTRLRKFEHGEAKVMQFDRYFFNRIFLSGILAPLMNLLMNFTHGWVGNWGLAIVLMTLLLKIVTLPFTLAASRSAKRMQKLQPQMQAVREKYKDNPQKLNQATIAIFKENKVNPMGGCIPILITIPLFVAFFAMLQGTAELRFQGFLWVKDLSAPDTVARISLGFMSLPINIMPLLMGATMVWQMRLTPTPTTDNMQMQIFKFMPIVFTLFCYNFAAGLALYSTVNGLFT